MVTRWLLILAVAVPAVAAPHRLAGRVVDEAGQPVPAASVYVYYAVPAKGVSAICPSCYRDCGKFERVERDGRFDIGDVDDQLKFSLLATADGYEPSFSEFMQPDHDATLHLRHRAAVDDARLVRGCVIDPDGKALVGAIVARQAVRMARGVIGYGEIPGSDPRSITDERGEFMLRVPNAQAKLDVRVRARNYAPHIERELVPGVSRTIRVSAGGTVTGRIRHHGDPVAGVAVTFTQPDRNSHYYLGDDSIGTDEEGRFVMTGLGNDTEYMIYVKMRDSAPLVVPMVRFVTGGDASATDIGEVAAQSGRTIAGCVASGGPVPAGTRVTLTRGPYVEVAEVAGDGAFRFAGVPNEPLTLAVRARGYAPHEVRLAPAGDVPAMVIPLEP